ncbi:MAG: AmmeMemoRadiSam system radical SAM enzyme [Patescibacteria group bacterium]|nr:AmmeMemoRadiSam system radical SAM enzyme [Patescibacteria group bacterium]
MKESLLYKKLSGNKVQCQTCCHYCLLDIGQFGKCGARQNRNGRIYFLFYGRPCAIQVDPIEKKPLYHFLPGTKTLSIATFGCNFSCWACQNWQISQISGGILSGDFMDSGTREDPSGTPEKIVEMALQNKCPSISYTYTEPTVFLEYAFDIMKLAKQAGLKNIWVSNGFFSPQTFELILPYLDAANIDLKSFDENFYQKYCGGQLTPVLENLKALKKSGVWLEITTLVIPTLNDSPAMFEKIAKFITNGLGPQTPWHLSRFSPKISWKLKNLPATPLKTMQIACDIAQKAGLKNVHLGNV